MALDRVAQRYAQALFNDRLEAITRKYSTRMSEVTADHQRRGLVQSGMFRAAVARVNVDRIEEIAMARVECLLEAYSKSKLPIDDQAVEDIYQDASQWSGNQGVHAMNNAKQRIQQAHMPPAAGEQIASTVANQINGVNARIRRKLSVVRDEKILAARTGTPKPEVQPTPSEPPAPEARVNLATRLWRSCATWPWFGGFVAGALALIPLQEYLVADTLFVLAAVSLSSKLVHSNGATKLKAIGNAAILCGLSASFFLVWSVRGNDAWSHFQKPLERIVSAVTRQPAPTAQPPATAPTISPPTATPPTPTIKTLHDFFLTDCPQTHMLSTYTLVAANGVRYETQFSLCGDFQTKSLYISFYLPESDFTVQACRYLPKAYKDILAGKIKPLLPGVRHQAPDETPETWADLRPSGRIFVYYEGIELTPNQIAELTADYKKAGLSPQFRGRDYVVSKNSPLYGRY